MEWIAFLFIAAALALRQAECADRGLLSGSGRQGVDRVGHMRIQLRALGEPLSGGDLASLDRAVVRLFGAVRLTRRAVRQPGK
jgi:hypothetical protein